MRCRWTIERIQTTRLSALATSSSRSSTSSAGHFARYASSIVAIVKTNISSPHIASSTASLLAFWAPDRFHLTSCLNLIRYAWRIVDFMREPNGEVCKHSLHIPIWMLSSGSLLGLYSWIGDALCEFWMCLLVADMACSTLCAFKWQLKVWRLWNFRGQNLQGISGESSSKLNVAGCGGGASGDRGGYIEIKRRRSWMTRWSWF